MGITPEIQLIRFTLIMLGKSVVERFVVKNDRDRIVS